MRFSLFKTPQPKKFNYQPRYYDPKKEEWERRKAELGYDSNLTKEEKLRLQMSRWKKGNETGGNNTARIITYFIYGALIAGSIYVILFTNLIENFLTLFGIHAK
ncbi:MAG: hypothetical protein JXR71_09285 [Bacteroidales bacterium]|nr:hypothetical protein [Bacteroidales bacterium]